MNFQDEAADPADEKQLVGSDRVLLIARELAANPQGMSLESLSRAVSSPKPTVHRGLAALRRAGFSRQDDDGYYYLGDDFVRLAFAFHEASPEHIRLRPVLERVVETFKETAHYMVLSDSKIVYRAKTDPARSAVKLSSVVGGSNPAHATAGGKVLLAQMLPSLESVEAWTALNGPLERKTSHTATSSAQLHEAFEQIRRDGYALDLEENEMGINCVAIPLWLTSPARPTGAISISTLGYRFDRERLPEVARIAGDIVREELGDVTTTRQEKSQ